MFNPSSIAFVGLGLEYHADALAPRIGKLTIPSVFDYLEIQPPHLLSDPGLIKALGDTRALLHSSNLSLGSVGIPMDPVYLALTCQLLHQLGTPWFGEHISWSRFPGGDTRHFVLPYLGDEVRDTIIANARLLHQKTGLPVLLENAPRTFIVDMPGDAPEGDFINDVVRGADAGFILDIDSARATAKAKGEDFQSYINSLPLHRTVEIHVHDPAGDGALIEQVISNGTVRAVTVGLSEGELNDKALIETVLELKALLIAKPCRSIHVVVKPK